MKEKVLIVDDDPNICELLQMYLAKEGYEVECVHDGALAVRRFELYKPDIMLLDIMLPGKDGWEICREVRKFSQKPIMMISAKGEVFDKVLGLELGADDYIVKPFDPKEVLVRIKAILRRASRISEGDLLSFDKMSVSLERYELKINGKQVDTPPKELELLYFLASNANRVFTRDQLLDQVWGYEYIGDSRTVDVHVKRLRLKLEGVSDRWELKTIWGIGYKFELNEEASA
ncbi:MAG: response regulator transcription factor [Clostridia bacterium]|nr:response regulator transcription factor [Clostridia bacterium]